MKDKALLFSSILFVFFIITGILSYNKILVLFPKTLLQQYVLLSVLFLSSLFGTILFGIISLQTITNPKYCLIKSPSIIQPFTKTGINYYFNDKPQPPSNTKKCFLPVWALLHILTYALISFFVPQLWYITFIIGILWEYVESLYNAEFWLDILWNGIGILFGVGLRAIFFPI